MTAGSNAALKKDGDLQSNVNNYDENLHRRFVQYKNSSGASLKTIATKIKKSQTAISQYISKKYPGDVPGLEKHIAAFLQREEDMQTVTGNNEFITTSVSRLMLEVLQYCDYKRKMGVVLAQSGSGKTETCKEYERKNPATIFVTADSTTRTPSNILRIIIKKMGYEIKGGSISQMLHDTIDRLTGSNRLLIVDDAHFLTWESFEMIRKLHDFAGIGVVYVGQERLYDQMKGTNTKAFLFDQIYSRIAIKRDRFQILKNDAKAIINLVCPGLSADCIDFLYGKARGKGRFRSMVNILDVAMMMNEQYDTPIDVNLLFEAEKFLVGVEDGAQ